jgi:hypothetical protein
MKEISQTFVMLDDSQVIALIETAQEWLVIMAPGLSLKVAMAIANRWQALGKDRVKVILDVDPEVARLGYGTLEGLELVQKAAVQMKSHVSHQAGLRIGLLIVDKSMIVFSPKPLLIEASSSMGFQPNAICMDHIPPSILGEIGWGQDSDNEKTVGLQSVTPDQIELIKADLQENPPQKFDITRTVQVFNSRFEFVEVEVRGCSISRKTATIPSELMAFIRDKDARNNLHSSYQIVRENSELSGKKIHQLRKQLVDSWLVLIPGFGMIVLRKNKEKLLEGIEELKIEVGKFQKDIQEKLQEEINHNCKILVQSLLSAVLQNPPQRWRSQIGSNPSINSIEAMLDSDLRKSFGSAEKLIQKMEVQVIFKAITYEMLNDPKFIQAIHKAIPTLQITHDEFEAARVVQATLF